MAYNTVKRMYKNPYYVITTETLGKLAKALGVSPGELIEEVPDIADETQVPDIADETQGMKVRI